MTNSRQHANGICFIPDNTYLRSQNTRPKYHLLEKKPTTKQLLLPFLSRWTQNNITVMLRLRINEPCLLCLSTQRRICGESRFLHLACCCDLSPLLPPSVFSSIYHSLPISVLLHPLQGSHEKSFRGRPINFYGFLFWHLKFIVSIKQLNVFLIS